MNQHYLQAEETTAFVAESEHTPRDKATESLRVTPEELALAAAALESKCASERHWRESTLPLEEGIRHLGLNARPEALLPEVEAIRAERLAQQEQERILQTAARQKRLALLWSGAFLGLTAFLGIVALTVLLVQSRRALHTALHPVAVSLPIQKLSVVPDNVPVHLDVASLSSLAKGKATMDDVSVDVRLETGSGGQRNLFANEWTVVKTGGALKVRAWTMASEALEASNDTSIAAVFSGRPAWLPASEVVPIELPIYRFTRTEAESYNTSGVKTDFANSVIQAINVDQAADAISSTLEDYVVRNGKNYTGINYPNYSYLEGVELKSDVVHLTGRAITVADKKQATDLAVKMLAQLHAPFSVVNEMTISNSDTTSE